MSLRAKDWALCLALLLPEILYGQYDPQKAFSGFVYHSAGNLFRSAGGTPSERYWQNRADYHVAANFDTTDLVLNGHVEILYSNNSPDKLDELWLQLDQNTDREDSRSNSMKTPGLSLSGKGYRIFSVKRKENGRWQNIPFRIEGTRMQIPIEKNPLKAGKKLKLEILYSYRLQESGGGGRSGYMDTKNGRIYEFSYWYPRMCVYDDLKGWNTLPFIGGGEMYLDYGNIDYRLSVPAEYLVIGAGKLNNGNKILNNKIKEGLKKARLSEKTLWIRSPEEIKESPTRSKKGNVSWHFSMKNTRDVSWAMSKAYLWDGARIDLPGGKSALAQSVYPPESTESGSSWRRSTEFLKFSVEYFSRQWYPFPYTTASSVAGPVGGMEYPGLAFNHWKAGPYGMFLLVSHEIGHTWFPMIVGSDERLYAWMDEGFNTFIDIYAHETFNHGEFSPKNDGEYGKGKDSVPADAMAHLLSSLPDAPNPMTPPDAQNYKSVHPLNYFKAAFGLVLLREVILGHERFDFAFRSYIRNWAFRHPGPEDFFRAMESGAGEDLGWFWNGWFYHNRTFDVAVKEVSGKTISIENLRQLPLPIPVEIRESDGNTHRFTLPVEIWRYGSVWKFEAPVRSEISSIILDPDRRLPDIDRSNNTWELKTKK